MTAKPYPIFAVDSPVAIIDYSRECEVHYGTVTSVTFAKNGYPITRVNFPTYGGGITREYAVEMLVAPEDVDAKVKYHKQGLMMTGFTQKKQAVPSTSYPSQSIASNRNEEKDEYDQSTPE